MSLPTKKFELNLSLCEVLLLIDSLECSSKHLDDLTFCSDDGRINFVLFLSSLHRKLVKLHNQKRVYDFLSKQNCKVDKDDLLKIII